MEAGQRLPPQIVGGSAKSRGKGCGRRKGEEWRPVIQPSTGKSGVTSHEAVGCLTVRTAGEEGEGDIFSAFLHPYMPTHIY